MLYNYTYYIVYTVNKVVHGKYPFTTSCGICNIILQLTCPPAFYRNKGQVAVAGEGGIWPGRGTGRCHAMLV